MKLRYGISEIVSGKGEYPKRFKCSKVEREICAEDLKKLRKELDIAGVRLDGVVIEMTAEEYAHMVDVLSLRDSYTLLSLMKNPRVIYGMKILVYEISPVE